MGGENNTPNPDQTRVRKRGRPPRKERPPGKPAHKKYAERRAAKLAKHESLLEEEVVAFETVIREGQDLLEEIAVRNEEPIPLRWAYYDGEKDENLDEEGHTVPPEYDSDGELELIPRERANIRNNNKGLAYGLMHDTVTEHEKALKEATGEVPDKSKNDQNQEMHWPTVIKALGRPRVMDQKRAEGKLPVCDRCKATSRVCDRTGWACEGCVANNVDCTWTHRVNHYTLHLATKDETVAKVGKKIHDSKGWERKSIRLATRMMIAEQDKLREIEARCGILQGALAARNNQQLSMVIQQAVQNSRKAVARVRQRVTEEKEKEIRNLHIQLGNAKAKAKDDEIKALRIENQRLMNEIEKLKGNKWGIAAARKPAKARTPAETRTRKVQARAAADVTTYALETQQTPAIQVTYSPPQNDHEWHASAGNAPPNYAPAEYPPAGGVLELITPEDLCVLQQAIYGSNETQQPVTEQHKAQQQPSDLFGNADPEENASTADNRRIDDRFGGLDQELFVLESGTSDDIAQFIQAQTLSETPAKQLESGQAPGSRLLNRQRIILSNSSEDENERTDPPAVACAALARLYENLRANGATVPQTIDMNDPEVRRSAYKALKNEQKGAGGRGRVRIQTEDLVRARYGNRDPLEFEENADEAAIEKTLREIACTDTAASNAHWNQEYERMFGSRSNNTTSPQASTPPTLGHTTRREASSQDPFAVPNTPSWTNGPINVVGAPDPNLPSLQIEGAEGPYWPTDDFGNSFIPRGGNMHRTNTELVNVMNNYLRDIPGLEAMTPGARLGQSTIDVDGDDEMMMD
ncbi:hypothetical protein BJX63DRAFT_431372 [Aspergillus granulosus]|uniref:Zn(2)-C6 fungal-type domain-containing protein n=1 Tax=Aspergillus granulosus TaxID=176169 RepID=A0ABR4HG59_9EURO